jgi:hypothetical protein
VRLARDGVPKREIAALAGVHRNTVGRIARGEGLASGQATGSAAALAPHLAELHRALMDPDMYKEDAAPLLARAAAALAAEALVRPDAQAAKTAQALGRLAEHVAALPD